MPRPILKSSQSQQQSQNNILSTTYNSHQQNQNMQQMDKMKLDRLLRKKRSSKYLDAIHKLDAGGHVQNHDKVNEIINAIKDEFPEVKIQGILLGIVSRCYLGDPYEVHTLDMTGCIIEHYETYRKMPNGLEKARSIAARGGYEAIEVYPDCCRAISSNGSVSVIIG